MNPIAKKTLGFCKKHAGKILTVAALAGMTETAILSAKGATKVARIMSKVDTLTDKEEVKIYLRAYSPAVLTGIGTAAAIVGIEVLGERKAAALAAAYALASDNYKKYRGKNIELFGKQNDDDIIQAVSSDYLEDSSYGISTDTGWSSHSDPIGYCKDTKRLFYEPVTGQFFWSTMSAFQDARYHLNRNFSERNYTNVDEFLWLLGIGPEVNPWSLEPDPESDALGWDFDYLYDMQEKYWVDICLDLKKTPNGHEYYAIYYPVEPVPYTGPEYKD